MGEREDVVADPAAVGVVGRDGEIGLVVEQTVDDVRRLAGGRDGCDVEGRVPRGVVRVEQRRRVVAVACVDRTDRLAAAGGWKVLSVRTGHVGGAEGGRQWVTLLGVDDPGERLAIGVLAQVPARRPGKLAITRHGAGIGHSCQAEIGGVGQHRGEHDPAIADRQAGVEVGEGAAEPGPAIHVVEYAGDARVGEHAVEPGRQILGRLGCDRLERGDLQPLACRGVLSRRPRSGSRPHLQHVRWIGR